MDIDLLYLLKSLLTFLINTTVSFLLLIVLLYILILNNKHSVYIQRLMLSFYFFSLLLLILVTVANSSPIDKYNHLILPKYPNDKNDNEILDIIKRMKSIQGENLIRNLHNQNIIESDDDFYYRYESVCFEYISTFFPFNSKTGKPSMHHGIKFQDTLLTDDDIWMTPFNMNNESTILYVGGYEDANSADILYEIYQSNIIIFEPVSSFYQSLLWNKKHAEKNKEKAKKFNIINKGLGKTNKKLIINKSNILADGTSFVKQNLFSCNENTTADSSDCIYIDIKDTSETLKSLKLDKLNDIKLLHMNCEGCEFEVLESLIEHDMLINIPSIVFDSHYADYIEDEIDYELIERYCKIHYELSKFYKPIYGIPFSKERWDRDDDGIISISFHVLLPTNNGLNLEIKMRRDKIFFDDDVEKNEYVAEQIHSFCEKESIDKYYCFQIWQKLVKDLRKFVITG